MKTFAASGSSVVCISDDASRRYADPMANRCLLFAPAASTRPVYVASWADIPASVWRVAISGDPAVASASADAAAANAC